MSEAVAEPLSAVTLPEPVWTATADAHRARAEAFLTPHTDRMRRGVRHPVWDFLFDYYSLRPGRLRRWHPGYGVTLTGARAAEYDGTTGYRRVPDGVRVDPAHLAARADTVAFIHRLLTATAARPPRFGCFGMHEWAMVYRSAKPRHTQLPLRLGSAGTDAVLETTGLRCSHYDAFRFFTAAAEPRNETPLSRAAQVDHEQPGCVHTNMDLAKWSLKLTPLIPAGLLLDCFELAANARVLDMRASPYDLRDLGFAPIRVEEQAGRAEYVRLQSEIADRAAVLRAALIGRCENLLAAL
ncbi:hypothetical protein MINS_28200 [Mycolicibacterium insubricum]|uniref:3-methyladenine DNA glycosylase n=1 Tax=Mycolicibacterium insubricum TaxID=444597 RepID=A0A1X0DN55_9MYCO|nr:3-methyladenine DNA glycosylase [Mycolicibacterium insubricum]BBZ67391.1 hypothetical protein MINS_28200 [Mycolicibacterium insubricum]